MTTSSFGAPLEQTCQRPGLWHIEGRQVVRRHGRRGRREWAIYEPTKDGGVLVAICPDLGAARDWIRQEIA